MEIFDLLYYVSLVLMPVALYFLFYKHSTNRRFFTNRDWLYLVKFILAKSAVKKYQEKCRKSLNPETKRNLENPKILSNLGCENHFIYGVDQNGNSLSLRFTIRSSQVGDVFLCLRLSNGAIYTLPGDEITKTYSLSGWQWKTKDLHIDILEPFKRLRVTYNGLLSNANRDVEHVQFNFIWVSSGSPQFYPQDASATLLADGLASHPWRDGDWISLMGDQRGYEQFGGLCGFVKTPDAEEILNLPSCRTRFWCTDEKLAVKKSIRLFVAGKDGALISLWIKAFDEGCTDLQYGSVITNYGKILPVINSDVRLEWYKDHESLPPVFTIHIEVPGKIYRTVFHLNTKKTVTGVDQVTLSNSPTDCDLNTQQAKSLVEFWSRGSLTTRPSPPPLLLENKTKTWSRCYVTRLVDENAKIVGLTGGKGCSLAMLKSIKTEDIISSIQVPFVVPDGFVVTVDAFSEQVESNFHMKKAVAILEDVCYGRSRGNLEHACVETVETFKQAEILPEIKKKIVEALQNVEGPSEAWAVRSSAIGEDSEDLSAAGQNDTFLGLKTADVINAVSSCWASLFTYQSVTYRHRHGLPVSSQMAVVVQKMVPSDCAGVLFTCHPSTGNPGEIVVTSNHGLGESVVSGRSEPDTIIVERTFDNDLTIKSKSAGSKRTVIRMAADGGVAELSEGEGEVEGEYSIGDNQALDLAKVGVFLEGRFGGARDVEWAYYQGRLFLLQSRPVTTLSPWSDFELSHEFDVAVRSEDMVYTIANTGEVLPGAISPLTMSTVVKGLDDGIQRVIDGQVDPYAFTSLSTFQHHVFIDVIHGIHRLVDEKISIPMKSLDLALFGHPITDERIHSLAKMRYGVASGLLKLKQLAKMVKAAWNNEESAKLCVTKVRAFDIGIDEERDTLKEVYSKIDKAVEVLVDIVEFHSGTTRTSVTYQIMTLVRLVGKSEDFNVGHYNDAALLLASCEDVVSAEIPNTLDQIAQVLAQHKRLDEFVEIEPQKGREWLRTNSAEAGEILEKFLEKHGHRGVVEFDLCNETWSTDPTDVIKTIQSNCKSLTTRQRKEERSVDEVIASLVTPLSGQDKSFLKFLMKRSRRAVGLREQTKSELIRYVNKLRIGYKYLGLRMAQAGLIPDSKLVFHLTHHEIGQIVDGYERSPLLISKALKRRDLRPVWNKLKFPEISYGTPVSESREFIPRTGGSEVKITGTPACNGVVQARACVITDLEEIDQLQKGDILITYCTDIGWSPYFPLLKGIVTELGGLVSHGAVIAREYGLPCIVGAKGATRLFKTGDNVVLSGKTGTIELV